MNAVLNVTLPVFAIILLGYVAGRAKLLGEGGTDALNNFVYWFALPALLFLAMARVPVDRIFNWPFLAAYTGGVAGTFLLSLAAGRLFFPNRPAALVLQGMTAVFSNTGYMGVPLFLTAFGQEGALPALILAVYNAAFVFGVAVVLIELDLGRGDGPAAILRNLSLALVKNPLVMSAAVGILWSLLGLPLPRPVVNFLEILGAASGPTALFAMGLVLTVEAATADLGEVGWLVVLKLLVQPALTAALAFWMFALEPLWGASAVILAALPTGALTFILAQRYGLYVRRATVATMVSTVLSVVTLSALFAWFNLG
jgi:predicted permease